MEINSDFNDKTSLLKRSLHTIRQLNRRLEDKQKAVNEPIAVIGMACRFPGGCSTPEAYWKFLKAGGDGAIDVPSDRWNIDDYYDPNPGVFGKMYVRQANFLRQDVGEFDAKFFRISPAEAMEMDPQHRLLLEVSWEALENAGQNIERLKGSSAGVFIGILSKAEYSMLPRDLTKVNQYVGIGTLSSVASGRISFTLGLNGPSLSVDTACSSSLVSAIQAVESLRKGECDMALAGGVNLMLSPLGIASMCMMGALAKDGRCKPFDANGDGYGRAEGCGILVLKRLSKAQSDGDNILAVIRGGRMNNDGASSGLTVPNSAAQTELLKSALSDCAISPDDISYLEAHGTGTSLGDPVEMNAVTEVFGQGRPKNNPLIIGTVKGNIGHLESAAGIAGLIKVVLCLQHKQIPRNINISTPNPRINFEKIPAIVPVKHMQWDLKNKRERIAGISSFGFSGANAHMILSESPPNEIKRVRADRPFSILKISTKSETALVNLIKRYADHFDKHPDLDIRDVCYSANTGRPDFAHRAAFVGESLQDLRVGLEKVLSNDKDENPVYKGKSNGNYKKKVAFLFNGDLGGLSDSAKELYKTLPAFKRTMETCDALFKSHLGYSIIDQLYRESRGNTPDLQADNREAGLFAIEYSFIQLLKSWGVTPDAVYGERTGGYVAALAAGVMDLETAVRHVVETSPLAANRMDFESAGVNAVNGGCQKTLTVIKERLAKEKYNAPKIRFISSTSGELAKKSEIKTTAYWLKQFIAPNEFERATASLYTEGYRLFLEIGSSPYLLEKTLFYSKSDETVCLTPITPKNPWKELLRCIARLYCSGADINWQNFDKDYIGRKVLLPTYPFERKRYWVALATSEGLDDTKVEKTPSSEIQDAPLDGRQVHSPIKDKLYEFKLSQKVLPELQDTSGILHVGYYQEMLARAVQKSFADASYVVKEMEFLNAMIISGDGLKTVFLILRPDKKVVKFRFYSKDDSQKNWNLHVRGLLQLNKNQSLAETPEDTIAGIKAQCNENLSGMIFYRQMEERGIDLGFSVQWVEEVWYREREALARFRKKMKNEKEKAYRLGLHPGILDACAQLFHACLSKDIPADMEYMVVEWSGFCVDVIERDEQLWCHAVIRENSAPGDTIEGRFRLFDKNGGLVASADKIRMKGISHKRIEALKDAMESTDLQIVRDETFYKKYLDMTQDSRRQFLTEYLCTAMEKQMQMAPTEIDPDEPLSELGMDSLIAIKFKNAVEGTLGVKIPVEELVVVKSLTQLSGVVMGLMEEIDEQGKVGLSEKSYVLEDARMTVSDMLSESQMAPSIRPPDPVPDCVDVNDPKKVLLTGSTGFIGAFLLHELLKQTNADVYCLVRAENESSALSRVRKNLMTYQVWDQEMEERIIPVAGDLSAINLGLSKDLFSYLAKHVEIIWHCGAVVNWRYDYSLLEKPNVFGTKEMLRLACTTRTKPFHFLSTFIHNPKEGCKETIKESDDIKNAEPLLGGYPQTKWVSECSVRDIGRKGLPFIIYRPNSSGHSKTGAYNMNDHMAILMEGILKISYAPDHIPFLSIIQNAPIDYIAKAMVYISRQQGAYGNTYHMVNPNGISWRDYIQKVKRLGYPVQIVSKQDFMQNLSKYIQANNPEAARCGIISEMLLNSSITSLPTYDCKNVLSALEGTSIECPKLENLIGVYLTYFSSRLH